MKSWLRFQHLTRRPEYVQGGLLLVTLFLFLVSLLFPQLQRGVNAANPGQGNTCRWYKVQANDTLSEIARHYHKSIATLARANHIANVNVIFRGQNLCIPSPQGGRVNASGLLPNGHVRWYAYNALEWSTRDQTSSLLKQSAKAHGLPSNLLLAIAWQESGWTQHVISKDGGIGVMQIMPYTAMSLNKSTGQSWDPYKTQDNIKLGASFLRSLCSTFNWNMTKVVSAYNAGAWTVQHKGIINKRYVKNVLALMQRFNT